MTYRKLREVGNVYRNTPKSGNWKTRDHLPGLGVISSVILVVILTHCGRVTQICVFNTVQLGTSASSP